MIFVCVEAGSFSSQYFDGDAMSALKFTAIQQQSQGLLCRKRGILGWRGNTALIFADLPVVPEFRRDPEGR